MTNNWNLSTFVKDLICFNQSEPEVRDHLWATDLGKPYLDTFYKLNGVPYSNPADGNGMFNFFLGKSIENGITQMLTDCGIAYSSQDKVEVKLPNCLPLTGKPDVLMEVKYWDETIKNIKITTDDENQERTDKKKEKLVELVKGWQTRYPDGLPKTAFEIKSCSEWGFENAKRTGFKSAFPHYFLQAYTYLYGLNLPEVHLLFVSKGSKMMTEEIVLLQNEADEQEWKAEIYKISQFILTNTEPAPEELMVKNGWGKMGLNWKIAYSPYKDKIISKYYPDYQINY